MNHKQELRRLSKLAFPALVIVPSGLEAKPCGWSGSIDEAPEPLADVNIDFALRCSNLQVNDSYGKKREESRLFVSSMQFLLANSASLSHKGERAGEREPGK